MEKHKIRVTVQTLYGLEIQRVAEEYAESKWISVEDSLPQDDQVVIICMTSPYLNRRKVTSDEYNGVEFIYAESTMREKVTHWMPLPDPPKTNEL